MRWQQRSGFPPHGRLRPQPAFTDGQATSLAAASPRARRRQRGGRHPLADQPGVTAPRSSARWSSAFRATRRTGRPRRVRGRPRPVAALAGGLRRGRPPARRRRRAHPDRIAPRVGGGGRGRRAAHLATSTGRRISDVVISPAGRWRTIVRSFGGPNPNSRRARARRACPGTTACRDARGTRRPPAPAPRRRLGHGSPGVTNTSPSHAMFDASDITRAEPDQRRRRRYAPITLVDSRTSRSIVSRSNVP